MVAIRGETVAAQYVHSATYIIKSYICKNSWHLAALMNGYWYLAPFVPGKNYVTVEKHYERKLTVFHSIAVTFSVNSCWVLQW